MAAVPPQPRILLEVRDALQRACDRNEAVRLVLVGLDANGREREIEATPAGMFTTPDGRERVCMRVGEGTEQMLLLHRIARVLPPR